MSVKKLERSIERIPRVTARNLEYKPIVLTDSKGWSVRRECRNVPQVQWEILNGGTTEHYYNWIRRNIASLQRRHNKVRLFLWTGTCDFTTKVNKFIYLSDDVDEAVKKYRNLLDQIEKTVSDYNKVNISYLPIPHLSIEKWALTKGHRDSASFKEQDKKTQRNNRH